MFLFRVTLVYALSLLLFACNGPDTNSSSENFFNLGLPDTFNKLDDKQEMKAHEMVSMAVDVLSSINDRSFSEGLELAGNFKAGEYVDQKFNNEVNTYCSFQSLSEKSRSSSKSITNNWVEDVQKSTRQLDLSKGQELIPCPLKYNSSYVTTSNKTLASETVSSKSNSLSLNIDKLKAVDEEKTTNQKIVYLQKTLSDVLSLTASSKSESTTKELINQRYPGKLVSKLDKVFHLVYVEAGEEKEATIKIIGRTLISEKMAANSKNLRFGRNIFALIVEMDSETATVEQSTEYNGDLDTETYTKVNGKLILENGNKVETKQ